MISLFGINSTWAITDPVSARDTDDKLIAVAIKNLRSRFMYCILTMLLMAGESIVWLFESANIHANNGDNKTLYCFLNVAFSDQRLLIK